MSINQTLSTQLAPNVDLLTGVLVGCLGIELLALLPLGFAIMKRTLSQHPEAAHSWSIRGLVGALALLGIGVVGHLELQLMPALDIAGFFGAVTAISALLGSGAVLIGAVIALLESILSAIRRS